MSVRHFGGRKFEKIHDITAKLCAERLAREATHGMRKYLVAVLANVDAAESSSTDRPLWEKSRSGAREIICGKERIIEEIVRAKN